MAECGNSGTCRWWCSPQPPAAYVSPYEFSVTVLIDADLDVAERALAMIGAAVDQVKWGMIAEGVRALKVSIDRAPRLKVGD